jgi:hypothetical protein
VIRLAAKARFLARYGNFSVGVQSLVREHFGTGESRVLKPRIDAQFQHALVTDEDLAVAVQSLHFPGLPFDNDLNQNVSPRFRLSVWDSEWARVNEGFSEEQIEQIIEKLRQDSGLGVDFIEVAAKRAAEPFPNYDTLAVEAILDIVGVANLDPEVVVAYEVENQNRKELVDALQGVTAGDDAVVVNAG